MKKINELFKVGAFLLLIILLTCNRGTFFLWLYIYTMLFAFVNARPKK